MLKRLISVCLIFAMLPCFTACKDNSKDDQKQPDTLSEVFLSFESGKNIDVTLVEKLSFPKKIDGQNWNMQGGDTDGKYGYYALNDGGDEGESLTCIYKIDFETWEIIAISDPIFCGHANDVTYIADTNQLAVTWCEDPIENATLINAETLEYIDTITYPYPQAMMDYSPILKQYVMGGVGKQPWTICDQNYTYVGSVEQDLKFAVQGIECDDKFIYNIQSPISGGDKGYLFVYNWEGERLHLITFDIEYECENISVYGNKLILAVNDHHDEKTVRFYEMTFSQPE